MANKILSWLPGWNSIGTTGAAHNFFELWGIVLFLVVVVFEFLAYFYGHRRDELIEIRDQAAALERRESETAIERQHAAETSEIRARLAQAQADAERARQQASAASEKVTASEAKAAPRHLTEPQKRALIEALRPFAGQHVDVTIPMGGSNEVHSFASEFVAVFRAAGWDAGANDGINQAVYSGGAPAGIQVTLNEQDVATQRLPAGADALMRTLVRLELAKVAFKNPQVPAGRIDVRVGPKEP